MERMWAWDRPATVRQVLDDLTHDRKLAYTTVMTVMDNLHTKGVLTRKAEGRAYLYTPARSRAEHSAELIATVLAGADDRTAPLLRFVEQMTPEEVTRLRAALEGAGEPAKAAGADRPRSRRRARP